ncbi:hypothetical protein IWZ00DRAFT_27873 [Phyllosticta capitalensis]|uniref:uncharacterized protein n=1 Tax=Phyllosticta capitalensis TaxID=121624 RepID=UPI00312ED1E8
MRYRRRPSLIQRKAPDPAKTSTKHLRTAALWRRRRGRWRRSSGSACTAAAGAPDTAIRAIIGQVCGKVHLAAIATTTTTDRGSIIVAFDCVDILVGNVVVVVVFKKGVVAAHAQTTAMTAPAVSPPRRPPNMLLCIMLAEYHQKRRLQSESRGRPRRKRRER